MKRLLRSTSPVLLASVIAGITLTVTAGPASAAAQPQAIGPYCTLTSAEPVLRYGSKDAIAVKQAQCELSAVINGPTDIKVDGSFGPQTLEWTEMFQSCAGLTVDGVIGPQTWGELDAWNASAKYC